jgi:signal peptidase
MTEAFKIIYYVFFASVTFIALLLLVSIFPIKDNFQVKIVLSGSMEPAIKTGSIVIIKPEENYKEGDVITFGKDTKKDIPTTHRIIKIRAVEGKLFFTTKGDANDSGDSTEIRKDQIIGKVLFSVPYVGYILDTAKKPIGFAVLVGVPVSIIVFDEVRKIFKEVKKIKAKKREEEEEVIEKNEDEKEGF